MGCDGVTGKLVACTRSAAAYYFAAARRSARRGSRVGCCGEAASIAVE
jgi:hypothetical protein